MATKTNRDFASFLDDFTLDPSGREEAFEVDLELDSDAEQDDIGVVPTIPFDYLAVADELHSGRIQLQPDRRKAGTRDLDEVYRVELAAYLDAAMPLIDTPPLAADTLLSIEPADIATELGLERAPASDFSRIRRSFAFANHPDRVAPHLRERAMVRMQLANMLIDAAQNKASKR